MTILNSKFEIKCQSGMFYQMHAHPFNWLNFIKPLITCFCEILCLWVLAAISALKGGLFTYSVRYLLF